MVWELNNGPQGRPRCVRCGAVYGTVGQASFPSLCVVIDVEIIMCCGHGAAFYGTVIFLGGFDFVTGGWRLGGARGYVALGWVGVVW